MQIYEAVGELFFRNFRLILRFNLQMQGVVMKLMKKLFQERNIVVILFAMVLVTFSLAQKESKKIEKMYFGFKIRTVSPFTSADKHKLPQVDRKVYAEKKVSLIN